MRLLIPFLFIAYSASAQIPNGSFETWTDGNPNSWWTSNIPTIATTVTKSTTARAGTAAAKGEVVVSIAGAISPVIQAGVTAEGFPYTGRPEAIEGYYQFSPQSGDKFGVNVVLFKGGTNGTAVAVAALSISAATSSYTKFKATFVYTSAEKPDVCVPQFMIFNSGAGNPVHSGSFFLLDDLSLTGSATAVAAEETHIPAAFELKQNYPNPFNPSTTISYAVPNAGRVQVKVFDRLGTEVATLVDGNEEAGSHSVRFNGNGLASGCYFVSLLQNGQSAVRPMLLVK